MKINNQLLFSFTEEASLEVRSKIVSPAEAAALPASSEASEFRDSAPTALAIGENEVDEFLVLLSRPWPFLYPKLVTAWLPPHITPLLQIFKSLMTQKPHTHLYIIKPSKLSGPKLYLIWARSLVITIYTKYIVGKSQRLRGLHLGCERDVRAETGGSRVPCYTYMTIWGWCWNMYMSAFFKISFLAIFPLTQIALLLYPSITHFVITTFTCPHCVE